MLHPRKSIACVGLVFAMVAHAADERRGSGDQFPTRGRTSPIQMRGTTEVILDNGVIGDGHLMITLDEYGSFGNWTPPWPDLFDPIGADNTGTELSELGPTFATHLHVFVGPEGGRVSSNARCTPTSHAGIDGTYNTAGAVPGGNQIDFEITQSNHPRRTPDPNP